MKKLLKNVWFWVGLVILILVISGGGYFFYKKQASFKSDTKKVEEISAPSTEKTDNPVTEATSPDEGKPTPEVNTALKNLDGVTLTVYLMSQPTTSSDGKTTVPANSIQPYFYPSGSGVYSIQKLDGTSWIDVASSINYPGHGGIAGAYTNSTEDNINYRVIKIENSKATAVSKTFVVKRSDLSSGFYTYN